MLGSKRRWSALPRRAVQVRFASTHKLCRFARAPFGSVVGSRRQLPSALSVGIGELLLVREYKVPALVESLELTKRLGLLVVISVYPCFPYVRVQSTALYLCPHDPM